MNLDPVSVIKSIAPKAASLLMSQAQRNEDVIKILTRLNLNPTQPPNNVDGVYAYTLVEYGVYKPEPILKVFREKEIKKSFLDAYNSNTPFSFLTEVEKFLEWNILGDEIRELGIDVRPEIEEFGETFTKVAKRVDLFEAYPEWDLGLIPDEFKALIEDKTRLFCGRDFVFQRFQEFLSNKDIHKGYFAVIGDAGMGKSAIASKYVLATKCCCYFNVFPVGSNTPGQFLSSIREQLIRRYSLQNADNANLPTLLQKAREKLPQEQKLVIVVDALDEVDQDGNGNLFDLPPHLPDRVYFFLTRRPYHPAEKRFNTSPDTPYYELDISLRNKDKDEDKEIQELSRKDIKEYIHLFMRMDESEIKKWIQQLLQTQANSTKTKIEVITLDDWRQKQDPPITQVEFVDILAQKSQNNFMYLRYVLPSIATGKYDDLSLKGLPQGLKNYYIRHWNDMGMDKDDNDTNVKILFILVVRGREASSEMIAEILDKDIYPIEKILSEWIEYVMPHEVEEDGYAKTYYSIYHRSFLEFLQERPSLDERKNKRRFQDVMDKLDAYFEIDF